MDKGWTLAYRRPRANRFLRVDLDLTWREASLLGEQVSSAMPGYQIYVTTTARAEAEGYGASEDVGNLLVLSGRRVKVVEGGTLPPGFGPSDVQGYGPGSKVWITSPNTIMAHRDGVVVEDTGEPKVLVRWVTRRQINKGRDHSRANYATAAKHTQWIERGRLLPRSA